MRKSNDSFTVHRSVGCGTIHLTIEYDDSYKPLRMSITLGKAGGCASSQLQTIQNLINEFLSTGKDISFLFDKENENSIIGIRCPQVQPEQELNKFEYEDEKTNLSCGDITAKGIRYAISKLKNWEKDNKGGKK